MSAVDVATSIVIARPRPIVSAYAADPDNAPLWYANITSVEWTTPPPLRVGSRIAFRARFLFRELAYAYEIAELVAGERLVMRAAEGPFAMQTTYLWADAAAGATRMTLRNCGAPHGLWGLLAPLVAAAMGAANRNDLDALKRILEQA